MLRGIDVSEHQRVINWNAVKVSGVQFAILRVGYGSNIKNQDDKQFVRNANECARLEIPFGVYLYSYANSLNKAQSEAQHALRLINGYNLSYPVYYDLEDANTTGRCSNKAIADMAETFCTTIEEAGHWAGIYANKYWFENKLTDTRFNKWVKWVAQYANKCTYNGKYGIWQYSSTGSIPGIVGNVDMNYCYVNYPSIIKGKSVVDKRPQREKEIWEYYISGNIIKRLQAELNRQFGAGLRVDGYCGKKTLSKLVTVRIKARGEITKIIQELLIRKGYSVGRCGADGVFGNSTYNAVVNFQRGAGLNVDGIVGINTWKALLRR